MFDKLIELILEFWNSIVPFVIINQYNKGVLLRLGIYKRTLEPGWYIKMPIIDEVLTHVVVPTTMPLPEQSLVTKDGKDILVEAVIKYSVSDIKILLIEVNDTVDAISDMTRSIIKTILTDKTWEECTSNDVDNQITIKSRVEARRWGVNIERVTLTSLARGRSLRLFNNNTHSQK